MKVLVAVKRAIDPNVKVGVKGDVQVSTRMACKLPLTLCVVACERDLEEWFSKIKEAPSCFLNLLSY
ncbi:hypothetical protein SRABI123_02167 [Pseudomonas sp. Bi123]|jgi:hypothetical protein|uniref:hypothetical protein n=1 Tax=Pseudomonas TaxID=286 RepID=UPI001D7C6053|nr:hypothetical protein [Pseudomonas sp. Bi123]CAH0211462.1 hypothetical protein SRABI123_02167 [Pseudomonas sp. Bi123]